MPSSIVAGQSHSTYALQAALVRLPGQPGMLLSAPRAATLTSRQRSYRYWPGVVLLTAVLLATASFLTQKADTAATLETASPAGRRLLIR